MAPSTADLAIQATRDGNLCLLNRKRCRHRQPATPLSLSLSNILTVFQLMFDASSGT